MNLTRRIGRSFAGAAPSSNRRRRIALYSHDALGLGHIRRNLAVARALRTLDADILLLTGAPEAAGIKREHGIDIVSVPALSKDSQGEYCSRSLSLGLPDVLRVRSELLRAAVSSFQPDLLIVDKHPRGFSGEMTRALAAVRRTGTRVVLGLRDVLDEPEVAAREWQRDRGNAALRSYYDEVWLYGDPEVHDSASYLDLRPPVRATGYLAEGRVPTGDQVRRPRGLGTEPYVLCALGGGSDGAEVATAFARATYPAGHNGVLVTGPHLPREARRTVRHLAEQRSDLIVHSFRDDLEHWYGGARGVVSMGGYNTVCEVLAANKPLLVVPRTTPRAEQLVRARALAQRGALDMCHPDDLSPEALGAWLAAIDDRPNRAASINLAGLDTIPTLAAQLLGLQEVATCA